MNKSELLNWLQEDYRQREALLAQVGVEDMDRPGVNGDWSMKDLVAHLIGWNRNLVAKMQAAQQGQPEPPPPWPTNLQTEDEVNAWIYEANYDRPVSEVLNDAHQDFKQLFSIIEGLPEDARVEQVIEGERVFHLVWIGEKRFHVSELSDHFRDDHEADVRAWIDREAE